jgi:hypothetical protein
VVLFVPGDPFLDAALTPTRSCWSTRSVAT